MSFPLPDVPPALVCYGVAGAMDVATHGAVRRIGA